MKQLLNIIAETEKLHKYFGYVENWVTIPLGDDTTLDSIWFLTGESHDDYVKFAESIDEFDDGEYYAWEIYTQRFLSKWVYRGEDYTMVVAETGVDGNKALQIFSNENEVTGDDRKRVLELA